MVGESSKALAVGDHLRLVLHARTIYQHNYIVNLDCHELRVGSLAALALPIRRKGLQFEQAAGKVKLRRSGFGS